MTWVEVRCDLDCGEVWISGPGWAWQGWRWDANICNLDGAWVEVTQEYWDLDAGDAGSGWRWDTNLGTLIAPRWDLEGAEIQSTRPGWGWDVTWIELRCTSWDVDRVIWDRSWDTIRQLRKDLDGGETHILKPVWVWNYAWMELRCNLVDLNVDEMLPGCRWDARIRTQIKVRFNWDKEKKRESGSLGGEETQIYRPGWGWDGTWIELRCTSWDEDGWYGTGMELRYNFPVEKWPGWRWNTHLETCMHLRWCLDGAKMQFGWPGYRRDANIRTWIEVRLN